MNPKRTILVADDDADDRKMINDALSALLDNFEIVNVQNGLEVMDYLFKRGRFLNVKSPPDLIFLDLNMPLLDGFEVLKGIRIQQVLSSIPVHVITVSRNPEDETKARKLGATGFHSKGYKMENLVETVRKIISGHQPLSGLEHML
jgi:two-component system response regulator